VSVFNKQIPASWLIPVGLIFLNVILKVIFLGRNDIAIDEPFTIFYSQTGFPALFEMLKTENNPPLFFVLLHFWIKVFGISALSVRFLPFLFSTLTAPVIFITGKRFFSVQSGLLASLIFTFSNYHLAFSHEARVYPLFALLTCLSMYSFFSLVQNPERKPSLYLLILANVLLIYSHFFGFFIIGIQILACLCFHDARKATKACLQAQVASLFLYLPYFSVFFSRFFASSGGTWVPPPVFSDLYTMVWRFSNVPLVTVFFLGMLMVASVKYFIKRKTTPEVLSPFQKILLLWFFFPYLAIFFLSFKIPMFLDRYLVFTSIAFYMMVAQAIVYTWETRKNNFYICSVLAIGGMLLTFKPNMDNHRRLKKVIEVIHDLKLKETPVLLCPEWLDLGFTYYYNAAYFQDYGNLRQNLKKEFIFPVNHPDQIPPGIIEKATSVILFEEWPEVVDKNNEILKKLSDIFSNCREIKIPEAYKIYYFSVRK
jgi:4-amino-4-deoxy-L-arabinose transferase-like glycosyltransferase